MSPSAAQPPLVQPSSDARTVGQPKDRLPITAKHAIRRLTVGRECCRIKGIMPLDMLCLFVISQAAATP